MIADLKPYAEFKESGLPWLGQVPGHWSVERTKWRFRHRKELNADGDHTNVLSLTLRGVVNNNPDNPEGLVPKDYRTYQFFAKGDLVFKLIDLENLRTSRVGLVHEDGIMSSAYVRLVPASPTNMRYFFHQFYDLYSRGIYNQLGAGVRSTLGPTDLLNVGIAIPPPDEQAAIVRFLDWANGRLERAIRAKRKVIALLNEQRQAIIHGAVTRGLDPSVPLKPSGIPWLGDIPQHWQVRRLKFVASRIVDCLHATPRYSDTGSYPAIRTADISPGVVHVARAKRISSTEYVHWTVRLEPREGDILYSREGERFGIAACVPSGVKLCISQRMMVFRIGDNDCPDFVMRLLNSQSTYGQALQDVMGATAPHVNISTIRNYFLALPEKLEQEAIVLNVASEIRPIDNAISRLEREIELLREYRTRLVADVVTGKLDVREAAGRLPEEAPLDTVEEDPKLSDETVAADEEAAV